MESTTLCLADLGLHILELPVARHCKLFVQFPSGHPLTPTVSIGTSTITPMSGLVLVLFATSDVYESEQVWKRSGIRTVSDRRGWSQNFVGRLWVYILARASSSAG